MPAPSRVSCGSAMACRVLVADEVYRALEDAVAYIANVLFEPSSGARLLDSFDRFVDEVSTFPDLFPFCAEDRLASRGIRKASIEGFLALYVVEGSKVYVIGFFHQTQDYARLV